MNNYESVFIATPVLSDQHGSKSLAGKFRGVITENGGQIVNEEAWGLKKTRVSYSEEDHRILFPLRIYG